MLDSLRELLKSSIKEKRIDIFDSGAELRNQLSAKFPGYDNEVELLIAILEHGMLKPFYTLKITLNKKLLKEMTDKFDGGQGHSVEQVETAIIIWAQAFEVPIKLPKVKIEKLKEERRELQKETRKSYNKKSKSAKPAIVSIIILVFLVGIYYLNASLDLTGQLTTGETTAESQKAPPEEKETKGEEHEEPTESTREPSQPETPIATIHWTEKAIIEELASLNLIAALEARFKFYGRKHILSLGSRERFHSNENDYVFLNDGTSVLGVFQYHEGAYTKISAKQTFEQLKLQGTDIQEIWVHFPTDEGDY